MQRLGGEPEFAGRSVVISHIRTGYPVRRDSKFSGKAIVPVNRRAVGSDPTWGATNRRVEIKALQFRPSSQVLENVVRIQDGTAGL